MDDFLGSSMGLTEAIDYLRHLSQDDEWGDENLALKAGGLTETQVANVERTLHIRLPEEYREFIKTYDLITFEGMSLTFCPVGDSEHFDERLIEANREDKTHST